MAASDSMSDQQFGPDVYKAKRLQVLYQRSLAATPVGSVVNSQDDSNKK